MKTHFIGTGLMCPVATHFDYLIQNHAAQTNLWKVFFASHLWFDKLSWQTVTILTVILCLFLLEIHHLSNLSKRLSKPTSSILICLTTGLCVLFMPHQLWCACACVCAHACTWYLHGCRYLCDLYRGSFEFSFFIGYIL